MAGTAIDLVNTYYTKAQEDLTALQKLEEPLNAQKAIVADLYRQIGYHQANGNEADANIASARYTAAKAVLDTLQSHYDVLNATYTKALQDYQTKKSELLSASEQTQLQNKQDADTANVLAKAKQAEVDAQAKLALTASEADKANQKKNTRMLIIGGSVIVFLGLCYFLYKNYLSKKPE